MSSGGSSAGRKLICASLLVLVVAAIAVYARLNPRFTTLAAPSASTQVEVPHTQPLTNGELHETIRLTGSIVAERLQMIQAPQLLGIRGSGTSLGNISSTSSPSSAPTFTPPNNASLRGGGNRFSDRQSANSAPSTPYSPPSTAGSVYYSLAANQSLRGSGDSDFNLTILKLAAPGIHVRKGDVIAEFDRKTQLLRLDDYKDTVKQLNDNLEKMRSDLQTIRRAHNHIIFAAKAELDKAALELKTAPVRSANEAEKLKLDLEQARARYAQLLKEVKLIEDSQAAQLHAAQIDREQGKMEMDRAQHNVDLMVVHAPMDGLVVLQPIYRGGDMGPAQQGDELYSGRTFMEVIDPHSMLLSATVNQVDAQRIRIGMKATVRLDAYPNVSYPAHITGLNALSKTSYRRPNYKGEIDVRVKIDSIDENVLPDISGSADIELASEGNGVIAPRGAIFFDPHRSTPYVYAKSAAGWERRDVSLGLYNHVQTVVRSGVRAGEVLALSEPPSPRQDAPAGAGRQ